MDGLKTNWWRLISGYYSRISVDGMIKSIKTSAGIRPTQALGNHHIYSYTKVVTNSGTMPLGEKVLQPNGVTLAKSPDRRYESLLRFDFIRQSYTTLTVPIWWAVSESAAVRERDHLKFKVINKHLTVKRLPRHPIQSLINSCDIYLISAESHTELGDHITGSCASIFHETRNAVKTNNQ